MCQDIISLRSYASTTGL